MITEGVSVTVRDVDGCVVLDIEAPHFTSPQNAVVKNVVEARLKEGQRLFVFNCERIQQIDSYGLATIIATLKLIRDYTGGQLALCGLNDMFTRLVKLTHLDRVLEVWPNEAQAIYYLRTLT